MDIPIRIQDLEGHLSYDELVWNSQLKLYDLVRVGYLSVVVLLLPTLQWPQIMRVMQGPLSKHDVILTRNRFDRHMEDFSLKLKLDDNNY